MTIHSRNNPIHSMSRRHGKVRMKLLKKKSLPQTTHEATIITSLGTRQRHKHDWPFTARLPCTPPGIPTGMCHPETTVRLARALNDTQKQQRSSSNSKHTHMTFPQTLWRCLLQQLPPPSCSPQELQSRRHASVYHRGKKKWCKAWNANAKKGGGNSRGSAKQQCPRGRHRS